MNQTTISLAQIIGPTLGILGLGIIFNSKHYLRVYRDFKKEPLSLMALSIGMIATGIAILLKHFMWGSLPEILISVLGLALLLKGAGLAVVPFAFKKMAKSMVSKNILLFSGLVWLIGGIYLSWLGYLL